MKTWQFTIITVAILLLLPVMMNNSAKAGCLINPDWPSAPCYGCPGCIPSKEKQREEWNPYYQYKGASWMEMMKTQMIQAMRNGTIEDWVTGNQSNIDVWRYYYLNDQAPFFRSSVSGLNDVHPYFPPPIQQLKTGISSDEVACKKGQNLVINSKNDSPACVKPETAKALHERGWVLGLDINLNNNNSYQPVDVVSILPDSSTTNPGGSQIKITLKNTGMTPITSLKAKLHLNNDYDFDFANVSQSEPLASGNLTSDSKILIGAGFNTILGYPLTITGTTNNIPFNFTVIVWISSTNTTQTLTIENTESSNQQEQIVNLPSGLQLSLYVGPKTIHAGQDVVIDMSLRNTLSKPVVVPTENHWAIKAAGLEYCTSNPAALAILQGYYTRDNMTQGKLLWFYDPYVTCPAVAYNIDSYQFDPLSSHAKSANCTASSYDAICNINTSKHVSTKGYWTIDGNYHVFDPGNYTIVGAEQSGYTVIQHFTVINSNQTKNTMTSIHDGTLSGNVVLAGGPRPGPQANYEVDVYASDGITIVGKTFSDAQGNYLISLPAGNYTIYAPDYPTKQTHHVSVISGKNTILDIAYGTGYK